MNNFDPANDLYHFIPPPNPLFPRNMFPEEPLSYRLRTREDGVSESETQREVLPSISLSALCEESYFLHRSDKVVYRRYPETSSLIDIRKLLRLEESQRRNFVKNIDQSKQLPLQSNSSLAFESRFESGNLNMAIKDSDTAYKLVLQNDINTKGHTQWFYFRVSNTTRGQRVRFNMINLSKEDSLFNYGMKVLVYSESEFATSGKGWHRSCEDIVYYKNGLLKGGSEKPYYSLAFTYKFEHAEDIVYFAYSCPYTYSDLMSDLKKLPNSLCRRSLLCHTVGGNRCELVTIPSTDNADRAKRTVFLSARVHPGETVASWVMKGALQFLTSPEAQTLREKFVFKVVPMLNPDGVSCGNYRCSLLGVDLNRRWKTPSKTLHPTVWACKRLMRNLGNSIELICDMHGHSRRKKIFMYGCDIQENPSLTRAFPYILSKLCPFFSYPYCSFKMQSSKESTLRISMFKETRVPAVYTLESSFYGQEDTHFTCEDYIKMGEYLCRALEVYYETKNGILEEVEVKTEECCGSSSGSDSEPSEDNYAEDEIPEELKIAKQKKTPEHRESFDRKAPLIQFTSYRKKREDVKKCPVCGITDFGRHVCKKISNRKRVIATLDPNINQPYCNSKGKMVRDQASQTYIRTRLSIDRNAAKTPKETRRGRESMTLTHHRVSSSSGDRWLKTAAFPSLPSYFKTLSLNKNN